jgi:hypothetical protein
MRSPTLALGLTTLLAAAGPMLPTVAEEAGSTRSAPLLPPGPAQMPDSAGQAIARNDLRGADGLVVQAEQRVITDTPASMTLPPEARDAIPFLDEAQVALDAGDSARARHDIASAHAML